MQILGPKDGVVKNAMVQSRCCPSRPAAISPAEAWNAAAATIENQVG